MITGIININKPKGITSQDVVSKLRKILKIKQIGHTGTLDPLATGVLPMCIGKATRIIEYLDTSKSYRAYILLGVETDTYDMEGEILKKQPIIPDKEQIESCLQEFKGEITQIPPIYSAVHYKGKRLYEYARKNIEITDIPERKVTINDIKLLSIEKMDSENPALVVDIDCSGGTYIRSIASDLGKKLGYGCCLENLTRTGSGNFRIEDSLTLEQVEEYFSKNEPEKFIIPPERVLGLERVIIDQDQKNKIKNGLCLSIEKFYPEKKLIQLIFEDSLSAIAEAEGNKIKPLKVFCGE
ncbi:MAG TPA: tRNA pseudouridine(55) synthase TruB [Candidatus Gastranaerophilales bacterium]|nr:tRNA pseudouridine(55) synthase TruB [Candidatus Gastranaerophilales bacterium]